jgi:hypothetical protein
MELYKDKRWTIFIKKYPLFTLKAERHNKVMGEDKYNVFVTGAEFKEDNCLLLENVSLDVVLEIEKLFDNITKN